MAISPLSTSFTMDRELATDAVVPPLPRFSPWNPSRHLAGRTVPAYKSTNPFKAVFRIAFGRCVLRGLFPGKHSALARPVTISSSISPSTFRNPPPSAAVPRCAHEVRRMDRPIRRHVLTDVRKAICGRVDLASRGERPDRLAVQQLLLASGEFCRTGLDLRRISVGVDVLHERVEAGEEDGAQLTER